MPDFTCVVRRVFLAAMFPFGGLTALAAKGPTDADLARSFEKTVRPFIESYCFSCHGGDKPEAELDLTRFDTLPRVVAGFDRWDLALERLEAAEMPPDKAKKHPTDAQRAAVVSWLQDLRKHEIEKSAGDPGVVLARRLSNAEYNYTIRDLTGVDLQPTKEFPQDPSNTAGFDNSGESLSMSPALLKKYLGAARAVADTMYLKPQGFAFAPYPMLVETDRDKFCVQQIIDFYHRQDIDYADYFQAAWRFKYRGALGVPRATFADIAAAGKVSARYLATVWTMLEKTKEEVGPLVKLQTLWRALPEPAADSDDVRKGCERMRDYVVQFRKKVEPRFLNIAAGGVAPGRQPMLIWKNVQYATHRRTFDRGQLQVEGEPPPVPLDVAHELGAAGEFGPGRTRPVINAPGDPDLTVPAGQRARYEEAFAKFCSVFPDMFYRQERGRNYFDTGRDRGRYLSAGFHNVMGYFRDDQPLYELILDEKQQKELDAMWIEMDFVASTTARMYLQFGSNREALGTAPVAGAEAKEDEPDDKSRTSEPMIRRLEAGFLAMAKGGDPVGVQAIRDYFDWVNATLRRTEKARLDAEPSHLKALQDFAARAYRHPLSRAERNDLLGYYHALREREGMDHESAIRECIVSVLMSPDLCYRIDLAAAGSRTRPLSDIDLASRLSYFLWSSLPDAELLAHAAAGDLHETGVIAAQARRMLKDPRAQALAVEFGGNWLDFRRFEGIGTVDRARFPEFTDDLRAAMFEEPVRFLQDVIQTNRSVLDCLYANDTFVNPVLAKHYGMSVSGAKPGEWTHIMDADRYARGGLLPMAVFLTKNAPGLRTSPVKRGNWVVKNILGERIPPPPPVVPELPKDEAKTDLPLREMLARHRADASCAACHARFDSMGLVFEGFGPVGERRENDLAGRAIDAHAQFPGGREGVGLDGLRQYIRDARQKDFVDNLCRKILVYALGRSPIVSDETLVQEMRGKLAANGYRFDTLVESIVTSPQFLNKRGRDDLTQR
ncbi:MAG TPA: DUF1592 domain-containing protein [Opitutaceae bacterium]|nr:DUF1592 domain-containing protein [Opitutaceae bacterium]